MSFQIKTLSIYSHDGRRRDLKFELGKLNIVTGRSETGKSTIVSIINYCLGATSYKIPVDTIHDSCSWFAVLFVKGDATVFVARPRLPNGQKTNSNACVVPGVNKPLEPSELSVNGNLDTIIATLSSFSGIGDIETAPREGRTMEPIQPSIKHSRDLILQPQSILASEMQILHGTEVFFEKQHLIDCLPYFLGVVGEDFSNDRARLRELRRELKLLDLREQKREEYTDRVLQDAAILLAKAKDAGMQSLPATIDTPYEAIEAVKTISTWHESYQSFSSPSTDQLAQLRSELIETESRIDEMTGQLESAQAFSIRASSFAHEGGLQESRLKLVSIFGENKSTALCPLCNSNLESENEILERVAESSNRLLVQLNAAERQRPRLAKYLDELRTEIANRKIAAETLRRSIYGIVQSRSELLLQHEISLRRARIAGEASSMLSSIESDVASATDGPLRKRLRREIDKLEIAVGDSALAEKMKAAETMIASKVTVFAKSMDLAQSNVPLYFDLNDLTLRFIVRQQAVTLERIGAQKNWVGYHIAVMLALHNWFVEFNCPIPRFSVYDQVSQPFFSNEGQKNPDRSEKDLVDVDREQVLRMIKELYNFCANFGGMHQIVLTEHVESSEPWFLESIVEIWRGSDALVPRDWPVR